MSEQKEPLGIEWLPIEDVHPYPKNPRKLGERAVEKVAASLAEFGWRQPIVVDEEHVIVVGHTRLLAAKHLGMERVPVHIAVGLTPAQAKAYRIADNRTAAENVWDLELLPLELEGLKLMDCDLAVLGFEKHELHRLMRGSAGGLTDPDAVPETPVAPVSRPGDLWLLGDHRLLCGDSTSQDNVERLMEGKRAALMATDPPYLVDYSGGEHPATVANRGGASKDKHWDAYIDHEHSVAFYADFLRAAIELALAPNVAVYQWYATARVEVILAAWREVGLLAHQQLIWHKSRPVLTRSDYMWDYEPFLYGWREGKRPSRRPPANSRAVWEVDQREGIEEGAGSLHPTMKPVELIRRCIDYHTESGGLIYEPFSGSGTALIAATMTQRRCSAIELSPAFVDVAVLRWQAFTGKQATLEGDGRAFEQIAAERAVSTP